MSAAAVTVQRISTSTRIDASIAGPDRCSARVRCGFFLDTCQSKRILPIGLAQIFFRPAGRPTDSRVGESIAGEPAYQKTSLHLSAWGCLPAIRPAEIRLAGPARSSPGSKWRCISCKTTPTMLQTRAGRLSSVLFPFSVCQLGSHLPQAASLEGDPASTFDPSWRFYEPLIFVGLRVICVSHDRGPLWSCVAGLFLGDVPLPFVAMPVWLIRPPPF